MGYLAVLTLLAYGFWGQQPPAPAPPPAPPMPPALGPAPPCEAYWKAQAVFSGEVLAISRPSPPIDRVHGYGSFRRATIRVDRSWRGNVGREVTVSLGPETSDADFQPGEKYLIYTHTTPAAESRILRGSRTRRLSQADEDLAYFERAERPTQGATVTGAVLFEDENDRPAAGYRVRLGNAEQEWSAETDAKGTFRFERLPAGQYAIKVDVPEGVTVKGPARLELPDPRSCAASDFRLVAEASIDLFVLDSSGRPAVRTTLELIDADSLSTNVPVVQAARTYADGSVGWGRVRAGRRYLIGLNVTRAPDPKRPLPIMFYPGVTDLASAHIFEAGPGEHVQLDTLRLPDPPARLNVVGTVTRDDGTPLRAADVVLRSAAKLSRGQQVGVRVKTDADGRFTMPAVTGYRYFAEVSLSVEGQNPRLYAVSEDFELTPKTPPLRISRARARR